ncbi:hypothetical protein H6G89_23315 [Oscillatoria sp. FACHB-1407]|uniref:hypothetical protein n=1 Tax=Oscillatoria sp. FACHB-1407 TaxID=2692847 RepID=UPI001686010F|nr:hypothetical protein [Oscillatoria sp. FACHB-1407]MBD2463936.1 hypothetical protein [Oscillatoria sp. FACHB-1407]
MTSEPNNTEVASNEFEQEIPDPLANKEANTAAGKFVKKVIFSIKEPMYFLAISLMGEEMTRQVWEEVQETIAYALILQLPDLIGKLLLGLHFSSFEVCQDISPLNVNRYACYTIVGSDFLLWISIAGTVLGRASGGILKSFTKSKKRGS